MFAYLLAGIQVSMAKRAMIERRIYGDWNWN